MLSRLFAGNGFVQRLEGHNSRKHGRLILVTALEVKGDGQVEAVDQGMSGFSIV